VTRPLLDTHVWIWWMIRSADLDAKSLERLDAMPPEGRPLLSAISLWEVATLVERGRLKLDRDLRSWLRIAASSDCVETVPIMPDIAAETAALPPELHRDPADRILIATARIVGCPIFSHDDRIRRSGLVDLWAD
jgi:PIN domain nuclease of toxin-antitoxin system